MLDYFSDLQVCMIPWCSQNTKSCPRDDTIFQLIFTDTFSSICTPVGGREQRGAQDNDHENEEWLVGGEILVRLQEFQKIW